MTRQADINYAIGILQYLHKDRNRLHKGADINKALGGSYLYFVAIIDLLKKKGLVHVLVGRASICQLGRPTEEINVYDVFLACEDDLQTNPAQQDDATCHVDANDSKVRKMQETATTHVADRHYSALTANKEIHLIPFDDILLFRTGEKSGIIEVHTEQNTLQARGRISRIARIGSEFFPTHPSYTVNINHIRRIDRTNKEAELSNGKILPVVDTKAQMLFNRLHCV